MIEHFQQIEFILYVNSLDISKFFYSKLFRKTPNLDVPGMVEFNLSDSTKIGLMPNSGIAKIIGDKILHPNLDTSIPRCELYLKVHNINSEYENALEIGAKLISPILDRDWGDKVCYFADPDSHIIAFAETII